VTRELVLSVAPGEVRGAVFEDDVAVDLVLQREAGTSLVGGCFFARVQRVVPSLPGAFLDLGRGQAAFLPGATSLVEGAGLVVRIVKDGFAEKRPEVSAALEFEGRLAIWTPSRPGIAVSRRLPPAERARLSDLAGPLLLPGEGAVLRSQAAGAGTAAILADFTRLRDEQAAILARAAAATQPGRLDAVPDAIDRVAAGIDADVDAIVIDDRAGLVRLRRALPEPDRVTFDGAADFAERRGLAQAFDEALVPRLALAGGGTIVIEQIEAFTAIDVNLASAAPDARAAEAILAVNCAAAAAVARQLRLRSIGGAVVVDFISMASREHRRAVETALADAVRRDPVSVELHGWTRLGHFEVTRKRGTASIADRLLSPGPGWRAKTPTTVALEALRALVLGTVRPGRIELRVHDRVAAELGGALAPALAAASVRAGRAVVVAGKAGRDPETFDIVDI
jgi:Rne/Rng family ribonuclease